MGSICALALICLSVVSGQQKQQLRGSSKLDFTTVEAMQVVLGEALGAGRDVGHERLVKIRAAILPLFKTLPKNADGLLGDVSMHYAVQRYFSEHHRWVVRGFEPDRTEQTQNRKKAADSPLESTLQRTLSHGGFAMQDLVVAVATIETLAFESLVAGLETVYFLNEVQTSHLLSSGTVDQILLSYFVVEHLQGNSTDPVQHQLEKSKVASYYPRWSQTQDYITGHTMDDAWKITHTSNPFEENMHSFEEVARIAQAAVSEDFNVFSNDECLDMKMQLSEIDVHGTGRVKLADFYKAGNQQFNESPEHLRHAGILDESSEHLGPQVIIPNYVYGMNNCAASTAYYDMCCTNECEGIFHHLEASIGAPTATTAEIVEAIEGGIAPSSLLSFTVNIEARNLSTTLRDRLHEIAAYHSDTVPLHGRLMAQWLHYAFPRECPFPPVSSTGSQQIPVGPGGHPIRASKAEMLKYIDSEVGRLPPSPEAGVQQWVLKEEVHGESDRPWGFGVSAAHMAMIPMILSGVVLALREFRRLWESFGAAPKVERDRSKQDTLI